PRVRTCRSRGEPEARIKRPADCLPKLSSPAPPSCPLLHAPRHRQWTRWKFHVERRFGTLVEDASSSTTWRSPFLLHAARDGRIFTVRTTPVPTCDSHKEVCSCDAGCAWRRKMSHDQET